MYAPGFVVTWLLAGRALDTPKVVESLEQHIKARSILGDPDISRHEAKFLQVRSDLEARSPKGGKSGGGSSGGSHSGGSSSSSSSDDDDDDSSSGGSGCNSSPSSVTSIPPSTFGSTNCLSSETVCVDGCIPTGTTCCDNSTLSVYCKSTERCILSTLVDDFYKCCPKNNPACDGDDFENSTYTEIGEFRFGSTSGGSSSGSSIGACASGAVELGVKIGPVVGALVIALGVVVGM